MSDFDQRNQSVDKQYNIGRDQIIQNIILVGQFLDFTNVEGLIPKPLIASNFESISEAFETTFDQRLGNDLAQATAFAGEVLQEVLVQWMPAQPLAALPFRRILDTSPTVVHRKLSQLNYWDTFCSPAKSSLKSSLSDDYEVLWLRSLQLLWQKHFETDRLFGIAHYGRSSRGHEAHFYERRYPGSEEYITVVDTNLITSKEFRVMMTGLVIDLIRLCSIALDDIRLWQGIINLLHWTKDK